jgi:hypothetical protein
VLQNRLLSSAGADLNIAQLLVFSALPYRETGLADRLRGTGDWRRRRRAAEELDEYSTPSTYTLTYSDEFTYVETCEVSTVCGQVGTLDYMTITGGSIGTPEILKVDPTPLPAALPLFATGLGATGLFGWRRKRKAAGIAA